MTIREHFLTTAEPELWSAYLPGRESAFGSLGYAQIAERFQGRVARLFVVESEHGWVAHPMLLRSISALPFAVSTSAKWDAGTPEYTGPCIFGDAEGLGEDYAQKRSSLASRERIVSEFAHLNPWSGGEELLFDGRVYDREIIWIDTTRDPDFLWQHHLEHRCRKSINRAKREGLSIAQVANEEDIREYVRIYQGTMARAGALPSYSFSYEYFLAIRDKMRDNSRFLLTRCGDIAIGGLLLIFDDHNVYAHLGGSDAAFHNMQPATFQIWEAIQWAYKSGKKRVVLGGGYRPNDGIFQFKASFSPLRQPFYVYKKIHLGDEYERLDRENRSFHQIRDEKIGYFPSYRYVKS